MSPRRRKVRDYVHVHEFASGARRYEKAIRVRTYEAKGELPLIILSAPEDPTHNVTQDVERIAAEVLLREYPNEAKRAKRHERWFLLVEHLPRRYDLLRSGEDRREVFHFVEFGDYRITVGGRLGGRRRVRNASRVLRENTRAEFGVDRVTLGYPGWHPTAREEVEREAGTTLDDPPDAPFRWPLDRRRGDRP